MGDLKVADFQRVRSCLEQAVSKKIGSGIAAAWGSLVYPERAHFEYVGAEGWCSPVPGFSPKKITASTFFDLASLTKILSTTSICMKAVESGKWNLTDERKAYLAHVSGYPAWRPIFQQLRDRFGESLFRLPRAQRKAFFLNEVDQIAALYPRGDRVIYSDIGFLHLMRDLESSLGKEIDQLAIDLWSDLPAVAGQINELHYRPVWTDAEGERHRVLSLGQSVAMTEICPWRGLLQGQVHDDNAWSMGGIAGHAGVFGRLTDVVGWIFGLFELSRFQRKTLHDFSQEVLLSKGKGSGRALGFDRVSPGGSGSTGWTFSPQTIGHLGFTGTSVWMDLDQGRFAVLLTNRVHPSRQDTRIQSLRKEFHSILEF